MMAWRIVKQPNGKFARFSEVVDDFTHMNMTEIEAIELCREYLGFKDAMFKVNAALTESTRWDEGIEIIKRTHSAERVAERIQMDEQVAECGYWVLYFMGNGK